MNTQMKIALVLYFFSFLLGMMEFQEEIVDFKDAVLPPFYAPDVKKTPGAKTPVAKRKREDETSPTGSEKKRKVSRFNSLP